MIIIVHKLIKDWALQNIIRQLEESGCEVHINYGVNDLILGVIGDTTQIPVKHFESLEDVKRVVKISAPYKKASRTMHPEDSIFTVDGTSVGGDHFAMIAGPCSVESEEQLMQIAHRVKAAGATMLRGGAYKPRTSPYSFQGMGTEGLRLLQQAKAETGLPIVSELMGTDHLDEFVEMVDVIQIGARNMQNFDLLKAIGQTQKTILLKRGLAATYEEWLMSAEYIMAGGNNNVILCERGIRTYDQTTRNLFDLQAVPVIQKNSHLPIIVDPSHAGGYTYLVQPMAKAGVMAGANGITVEVHHDPANALSDGQQALTPDQFDDMMAVIKILLDIEKKKLG
ncbi:3-deoxy-7-phosphoheptulonate synthase [Streptococcus ruminantium]|uniref:3-deoxy-7-phosphoheptulonate synthase n=1 Tax=Streptococcus ruminantium TaxID=1917441 RepID=UPI0012DEEFBF|nr:3-deoxy-7-phosphoheptulonate synthase [Streptococcus ruminantium]